MKCKMDNMSCGKTNKSIGANLNKLMRNCSLATTLAVSLALSACNSQQVLLHGAIVKQDQIDLVPIGSSREQVLLTLGTPSTTGTFDAEVFYYISQRKTKNFEFQKGKVTDQKVFAVYFDEESQVKQLANYGLQDGKVFDFISRTTPTSGADRTFLAQLFSGRGAPKPTIF